MAGSETLYRRGAAWYWRRRIPRRLSKFFTISTVRISTKGYLLTEARAIARAMNAVADILFAALDDLGDVSDMHVARIADQADTLLREALYGILTDAEAARARAGRRTLEDAYAAQADWLHEAEAVRRRLATNDLDAAAAPPPPSGCRSTSTTTDTRRSRAACCAPRRSPRRSSRSIGLS